MPLSLAPHHQRALDAFVAHMQQQPESLAVIVGGSLAKGWGTDASDVDVMALITDEAFGERYARGDLAWYAPEFADYPHGFVDVKFIDQKYLDDAADRANEPTRAAFTNAGVAWTRDGNPSALQSLVRQIATYPEAGVEERIARFHSELVAMDWYIGEADKRANAYLASWVGSRAALFAARMILAHNRVLFPFHKWMLRALQDCAERPAGLPEAIDRAVRTPNVETVRSLASLVTEWRDWPMYQGGWAMGFIEDVEWAWRYGEGPIDHV
ncbi:MAG: hypothetical protein AAFY58_02030 [Planctomycetota bacterium]